MRSIVGGSAPDDQTVANCRELSGLLTVELVSACGAACAAYASAAPFRRARRLPRDLGQRCPKVAVGKYGARRELRLTRGHATLTAGSVYPLCRLAFVHSFCSGTVGLRKGAGQLYSHRADTVGRRRQGLLAWFSLG